MYFNRRPSAHGSIDWALKYTDAFSGIFYMVFLNINIFDYKMHVHSLPNLESKHMIKSRRNSCCATSGVFVWLICSNLAV